MSTHNTCFCEEIRKIFSWYSLVLSYAVSCKTLHVFQKPTDSKWVIYNIFPKCYDTLYHTYPKICSFFLPYCVVFHYLLICVKTSRWMANSVDPDRTSYSEAFGMPSWPIFLKTGTQVMDVFCWFFCFMLFCCFYKSRNIHNSTFRVFVWSTIIQLPWRY